MYEGFLEFSGTEIVNAERTEAYVSNLGDGLSLRSLFRTDKLHIANEETAYESPLIDDAPWASDADAASSDFFGLYPLSIEGVGDSTMSSTVTEHLDDGGSHGIQRDASRAIRVHGLLVGASREGAEAGLSWLAEAVRTSECALDTSCGAGDLRYYLAEPDVCVAAFTDAEQPDPSQEFFGDIGAGELLSYRWPRELVPVEMPSRARWDFSPAEGTVIRYGAYGRLDQSVLYDSGPIAPLRRNYALNPGTTSSLTGYGYTGNGTMSWAPFDETGPARAILTPSTDPDADRVQAVSIGTATLQPGTYTVSIDVRGDVEDSVAVAIQDGAGNALASGGALLTQDFQRVSVRFTTTTIAPVVLLLQTTSVLEFTDILVELGEIDLPYFDGDTALDDYVAAWAGDPGNSASSLVWTGAAQIENDDSNLRPFLRVVQGMTTSTTLTWWLRYPISMLEQLDPYERTLHRVQCSQGPQVIQRYFTTNVGYFIEVDLVFVAGNPHAYSPGVAVDTVPLGTAPYVDPDDDAEVDDLDWLVDPDALAITTPVYAPVILDPTLRSFSSWQRYYVAIPASVVQSWGQTVPTIGINSKGDAIKQVRLRFHPNPFGYEAAQVDPLNYCGEIILSYLPSTSRIVVDGVTRSAIASKGGKQTVSADHLLYGANGSPAAWPELSCGIPYVLTIDVPSPAVKDQIEVDLVLRRRG